MSTPSLERKDLPMLRALSIETRRHGAPILRNVSIAFASRRVSVLLGPSGAGKTSLFRILAGEEAPYAGHVFWSQHNITREPLWKRARRGLGYLPQGPSVLFGMTVRDNIRTFASITKQHIDFAMKIADRMELSSRMHVLAGELSGGERRRLELARALIAEPSVLICDEPFSGVDPAGADRIADLLRSLCLREGLTVILADHHVNEALSIADDVFLLIDGVIEMQGTPDEFLAHPLAQGRYLGHWTSGESIPPSRRKW